MTTKYKQLALAPNLRLPIDAVTQKLGFIGTTGSGKTYSATKFAELMYDAGAQFVVLDPVGVHYGLRLAKNGRKPSDITIPIFGGLHGDVQLEPTAGALIADLIVDRALTAIIDVSQFEHDSQKARFAADFADRFFFRKKAAPSAVHLFLEECQEFIPENQQRGEERMLHAFVRLLKIGRNFGIGASLITQRPQEVAKKALNLVSTLFVFRTTGAHERAAIERWIKDKAIEGQDIAGELPKLKTGAPHVWSPEWLGISEVVRISEKRTFNASATPEVGAVAVTRELAPIDLAKIRTEMAATIEKQKESDPAALKKRIVELEKSLSSALVAAPPATQVTKAILTQADLNRIDNMRDAFTAMAQSLRSLHEKRLSEVEGIIGQQLTLALDQIRKDGALFAGELTRLIERPTIQKLLTKIETAAPAKAVAPAPTQRQRTAPASSPPRERTQSSDRSDIAGRVTRQTGERAVLIACADAGADGVERRNLSVITGYKRASRDAFISRLSDAGYVEVKGQTILVTPEGVEALGDWEPLPKGKALQRYWLDRLPTGEQKVLEIAIREHPKAVVRTSLDQETNYKRSSRDAYISRLLARGLISVDRGNIRASDRLF